MDMTGRRRQNLCRAEIAAALLGSAMATLVELMRSGASPLMVSTSARTAAAVRGSSEASAMALAIMVALLMSSATLLAVKTRPL